MRRRAYRVLLLGAGLLLIGILYALLCSRLGFGIPCPFHLVTGLQCPGCGVSRMCLAILHLDFSGAWQANPAVFALLPLGLAVAADLVQRYIRQGVICPKGWSKVALWGMIAILVIFGICRNLPIVV